MAKLWKIKAWFHNLLGKVIGLAILIAIIYGIYCVMKGSVPVAEYLDSEMGVKK
jgi:hypothetical protein